VFLLWLSVTCMGGGRTPISMGSGLVAGWIGVTAKAAYRRADLIRAVNRKESAPPAKDCFSTGRGSGVDHPKSVPAYSGGGKAKWSAFLASTLGWPIFSIIN